MASRKPATRTTVAGRKMPAPKSAARKVAAPAATPPRASAALPPAAAPMATKPQKSDKAEKTDKARKPKLVRDSYTIPKAEYAVLAQLKQRAALGGAEAKKSELLRAGIQALAGMGDAAFRAALAAVPTIKTGRPAKD